MNDRHTRVADMKTNIVRLISENAELKRERDEARDLLKRIATEGEFMDMEGQRLVVFDWLARRHIAPR